ncbi:GH92 family glycosyl hydrolase [Marinilabilia salmonicolor]|jgi:predicted alpha-1,2-mannosidase|uniref:Putative alpha-1,2-mannosidase n=1 Tax=Marinilabilia salmonicolor TaxID=989 RepID=A0A2T0XBW4_9BACT|nr:GH92 family glycosyl hydrolase [Marinilabilia salmonicolor]PRY96435.1 putative alpha-1,2-mannosidase [Marinilabilia salmonicolor]RCW37610.1 putative alpha-1,2-mannosidase [Marinilabilia salmonicolor]
MKQSGMTLILSVLLLWSGPKPAEGQITAPTAKEPVDYVNPLIGTDSKFSLSNGNTYPAMALPWGMNFWTPQTAPMGDGWQYAYDADKIRGFKQTHQPSPWMNDYGNFSLMPVTGELKINEEERASWFSHKAETANPHYYSVYLAEYDVTTELTVTERAARFRFTFPENDQSYVIIDAFDQGSYVKVIPEENKIIGYSTRNSGGVPENFRNYFVVEFDKPFSSYNVWEKDELKENQTELTGEHAGVAVRFNTKKGEVVNARVASSFISHEQANLNLKEIGSDNFETVKAKGREIWNRELGRMIPEGGTLAETEIFYSALYRTLLFPRKFYEYDSEGNIVHYSPYNGKVLPGYMFTDNGFWDTFRAVFPFFNLMYPSLNEKIQAGLVNAYKESGFLPEWASPGHRSVMIGNNSATLVADAYLKGLRGYDMETLYEAVLHGTKNVHAEVEATGRLGHEYYNELGYVPYDVGINENAARTLEYAFADWTIWKLAKELNRPKKEIKLFEERSQNYRKLFDSETNLMRGKNEDGSFQTPFNPLKWGDAFTEGNSWHYTWSVFHDTQGLINLMGGEKTFITMLDSVFAMPPDFDDTYYGFPIHEIREMQIVNMGQYAHGNQPIQHMIYLYNYAGQPWKAQYWLREVMDRLYTPDPDGYCGDEDNGQTSAWYVFSSMGFYPVTPGSDQYVLGTPLFPKMTVQLENGNKIILSAPKSSSRNRYIDEMHINGQLWDKNYVRYSDLMEGAFIEFRMADEPNKSRGTSKEAYPYSYTKP